jgi:hypothetical protein
VFEDSMKLQLYNAKIKHEDQGHAGKKRPLYSGGDDKAYR